MGLHFAAHRVCFSCRLHSYCCNFTYLAVDDDVKSTSQLQMGCAASRHLRLGDAETAPVRFLNGAPQQNATPLPGFIRVMQFRASYDGYIERTEERKIAFVFSELEGCTGCCIQNDFSGCRVGLEWTTASSIRTSLSYLARYDYDLRKRQISQETLISSITILSFVYITKNVIGRLV